MMKFINYCTVKLEILKTGQIIISSNSRYHVIPIPKFYKYMLDCKNFYKYFFGSPNHDCKYFYKYFFGSPNYKS
uniref:Uncharacterized protein n=1 Tax=Populus trichocarpa TaxID=3694 RepID=A0A2K1Y4Q4_POPTR